MKSSPAPEGPAKKLGDEYTCAYCGGVFGKQWSEEDALNEMRQNFGNLAETDRAVICDACYRNNKATIMAMWKKRQFGRRK